MSEGEAVRARMEVTRRTTPSQAGPIRCVLTVPMRIGPSPGIGRLAVNLRFAQNLTLSREGLER